MSREGSSSFTSHPVFRWAVAAWFAALLGGGMFVMPRTVHRLIGERLGTGDLPHETLRLAIAVGAGALGLVIGFLIAGRGRDRPEEWDEGYDPEGGKAAPLADDLPGPVLAEWEDLAGDPAGEPEAASARVFSARDELGGEGIAAPHHLAQDGVDDPRDPDRGNDGASAAQAEPLPDHRPAPSRPPEAIGDLSLAALTARLERAMIAARGGHVAPPHEAHDPAADAPSQPEPEEALRSALDKLSRFRREE